MSEDSALVFGMWRNPHNKEYVHNTLTFSIIIFIFFVVLAILFGLYGGHFSYGFYIWLFIAIFGTSLLLAGLIYNEFLLRPKIVEIRPDGVILVSQTGKSKLVPWHQLRSISSSSYSGDSRKYYSQKEARIAIRGQYSHVNVCLDVAEKIRLAYKGMTGLDLGIIYEDK